MQKWGEKGKGWLNTQACTCVVVVSGGGRAFLGCGREKPMMEGKTRMVYFMLDTASMKNTNLNMKINLIIVSSVQHILHINILF